MGRTKLATRHHRDRVAKAGQSPILEKYRNKMLDVRRSFVRETGPRIAVYTGAGASHSWTWYADFCERLGLYDLVFIRESDIAGGLLGSFDAVFIGGGDTHAMAEEMGETGARTIEGFVEGGGLYFGSCAGAYLVLSKVDISPYTPFTLIEGDMLNVDGDPPRPRCLQHKYKARYGDRWVFHPIYGEVIIIPGKAASGFSCFREGKAITAPMYGGPVMAAGRDDDVLALFSGETGRAAFLWERAKARELIDGKAAVVSAGVGRGTVVACGPHLEHPLFPRANAFAAEALLRHWGKESTRGRSGYREPPRGSEDESGDRKELLLEIRRQVSNARIVGFGLEKMPVTWRMGLKVWEPEKIRMFLDCAWRRIPFLESHSDKGLCARELGYLAEGYAGVTGAARSLKISIESGADSSAEAIELLAGLKELTAVFLSVYFKLRAREHADVL